MIIDDDALQGIIGPDPRLTCNYLIGMRGKAAPATQVAATR